MFKPASNFDFGSIRDGVEMDSHFLAALVDNGVLVAGIRLQKMGLPGARVLEGLRLGWLPFVRNVLILLKVWDTKKILHNSSHFLYTILIYYTRLFLYAFEKTQP